MAAFFAYGEDYLKRDDFLALAFNDSSADAHSTPPPPTQAQMQTLWLTAEMKAAAQQRVGWVPRALRLRYWQADSRSAWILEHIGKEKPITFGVVVREGRIERVEVLAFRESRGWEIRYPFFTEQFGGVGLAEDGYLTGHIDGITGATLSVRAAEKVARMALWLDAQVRE
ncbi:MAG: hypothetical protein Hals2KO_37380 [Halioglobus sp.]